MARGDSGSTDDSWEARRVRAVADLDALIEVAADARKNLRAFQSTLEKNRRHLAGGGRASDMVGMFDIPTLRTTLTERLNRVERARSASRRSLWRLQRSEGTTIAEIARMWGLSRQLVSRALADDKTKLKR